MNGLREPRAGFNINNAEPIMKVYIFFHFLAVSIWEILIALVSNIAPKGWCPYKNIEGQTILITGAANGLGRLLALRFATHNDVTLILWDRDDAGLKKIKDECMSIGAKVSTFTVDMVKNGEIKKTSQKVMKEFRHIDIIVNNAGIGIGAKLTEMSEENIRKTFELNTLSHFWMAKEFLPDMYDRNQGHIVTIVSLAGITASPQDMIAYGCSKFSALSFMEGLENESKCLGKDGLRFTSVCPSYFQTQLLDGLTSETNMDVMTPAYVADHTIDAILRELRIVFIPKMYYGGYALKGLVPRSVWSRALLTFVRNQR